MPTGKPTGIGIWWASKSSVLLKILGQDGCVLANLAEVDGFPPAS